MTQTTVKTDEAPAPVGPYSPAIIWKNLVFVSGQGPLNPQTGQPIRGDIIEQTSQVFKNIDALLTAAGSSRNQVLKVTVFLADIEDFAGMNSVYEAYFQGATFPARTTIEAAALPLGIGVEIDVIAYRLD